MSKFKPTIEQIEARQAKKARMRDLAKTVAAMSDDERAELSKRYPIVTIEGRPLSQKNQLLLVLQSNGLAMPTVVGGFRQWKTAGRSVIKGQKALSIWIPTTGKKDSDDESGEAQDVRFICGSVFDITQTQDIDAAAADPGEEEPEAQPAPAGPLCLMDREEEQPEPAPEPQEAPTAAPNYIEAEFELV